MVYHERRGERELLWRRNARKNLSIDEEKKGKNSTFHHCINASAPFGPLYKPTHASQKAVCFSSSNSLMTHEIVANPVVTRL